MTTPTTGSITGPGPAADALVLFGVTGDLARKMILPALYRLTERGELTVPVIGVARSDWSSDELRKHAGDAVGAVVQDVDGAVLELLQRSLHMVAGDYNDPTTFERLAAAVSEQAGHDAFVVHYLAVPPSLFGTVADALATVGLTERCRLVVEKPFGHDLASARELNSRLRRHVPEERLFRVDHYLGKEPVEDLLVLRFANTLIEPLWDRTWIDGIEITMAEDFDVADRGSFYDAVGTVRDVVQNHLLQVLALLTMESPQHDTADDQRDAKYTLLSSVRAVDPSEVVRGQYTGYRDVPGVAPDSTTETYVALTLHIDTWRWTGVPVHIRAGKALAETLLDIVVTFRPPPHQLFRGEGGKPLAPNRIRLCLQPDAGVTLFLFAKQPGGSDIATELPVGVDFRQALGPVHEAYERIFADALAGDPTHFARMDSLEEAWRIVEPILDLGTAPLPYAPGTWGPTRPGDRA